MNFGRWLPWVIVAVLAALLLHKTVLGGEMSVAEAAAKNLVSVGVASTSDNHVALTVTRSADASGDVTVVLAAGTVIFNADAGGQRLMTATSVTLALTDEAPSATADVEVYCLDQFALMPSTDSVLSLDMQTQDSETEEANPVRKLAQCLEDSEAGHGPRQMAIWLQAGGYLDQDYANVRRQLRESYRTTIGAQAKEKLADFAAQLRQDMPELSEDRIDAAVERYRVGKLDAQVDKAAESQAQKDLDAFVNDARPALERCDSGVSERTFFTTLAV